MDKSIDVCFTFDTTGSMYPCLSQVRQTITQTVERLFNDIQDLRIAIIAHGDYCDIGSYYITKRLNFTSDRYKIVDFVNKVGKTGGGDSPECYELVLNEARTLLDWQNGRSMVIVMIGDDEPHPVGYRYGSIINNINWRNELGLLTNAGISVYGVHCMPGIRRHSKPFYQEIADKTNGFYLTLDQFSSITDLILGICYKQKSIESLDEYEKEVSKAGRLNKNIKSSFNVLRGLKRDDDEKPYRDDSCFDGPVGKYVPSIKDGLVSVPRGRFQVMKVDEDISIRDFIDSQGIEFEPGRGFYELTKSVKVQQHKEIILQDKRTGEIFNGSQVREILGLSPQGGKIREKGGLVEVLKPVFLDKYKVFIQSTSYNRKLIGCTSLMYEVLDK